MTALLDIDTKAVRHEDWSSFRKRVFKGVELKLIERQVS